MNRAYDRIAGNGAPFSRVLDPIGLEIQAIIRSTDWLELAGVVLMLLCIIPAIIGRRKDGE